MSPTSLFIAYASNDELDFPRKSRVEKKTIYLRREKDHEQDTTAVPVEFKEEAIRRYEASDKSLTCTTNLLR